MKLPNNKKLLIISTATILAVLYLCLRKGENTAAENGITTSHTPQESVNVAKDAPKQDKDRRVTRSHKEKEVDLDEYERLDSDLHTKIQYDEFNGHELKISTLEDDTCKMTLFEVKGKGKIGITYNKDTGEYTLDVFSKNGKQSLNASLTGPIGIPDTPFEFDPKTGNVTVHLGEGWNKYDVTYNKIAAPGINSDEATKSTTVQTATPVERKTPNGETFTGTDFSDIVTTNLDAYGNVLESRIEGDIKEGDFEGARFVEYRDANGDVIKREETGNGMDEETGNPFTWKREINPDGSVVTTELRLIRNPETGEMDKSQTVISYNDTPQERFFKESKLLDDEHTEMKTVRHDRYAYGDDSVVYVNSLSVLEKNSYANTYGVLDENGNLIPLAVPTVFVPYTNEVLRALRIDGDGNTIDQYFIKKEEIKNQLERSDFEKAAPSDNAPQTMIERTPPNDNAPQTMIKHSGGNIYAAAQEEKMYQRH